MKSSLQLRQMCPSWCDGRLPHSGSWRFPILANSWNSKCKKKPRAGNIATTCLKDYDFNQIFLVFYSLIKLPVNDTKSIAGWSTVPTAKRGTPPPPFPIRPHVNVWPHQTSKKIAGSWKKKSRETRPILGSLVIFLRKSLHGQRSSTSNHIRWGGGGCPTFGGGYCMPTNNMCYLLSCSIRASSRPM